MTNSQNNRAFLREQRGKLYDLGDHGLPSDMWDCSGLMLEMAELCGKIWEHSSNSQYYDNPDLPEYGEISTMPRGNGARIFLFQSRFGTAMQIP
jgi:hypothetical protein